MSSALEDVFSGGEPEQGPVVEELVEEPVQEEVQEDQEVPEVPEEPKGEEVAEPPSETKEVPLAALLDERDKRKAAEERLREFETQNEEKPDFWENPENALKTVEDRLRSEFEQKTQATLVAYSMESAAYRHEDYESGLEAFKAAAEQNPALADEALRARDPGEYIYQTGMQFKQLDEVGGDINSLRERIRAEERAKLETELKAKSDKLEKVPEPITDETSAAAPREKVEGGRTPLDNIFGHNDR